MLTVEVLFENLLGVFLGLSGGVGVVQVGLVTADDLSLRSHVCGVSLRERCGSNGLLERWCLVLVLHWLFVMRDWYDRGWMEMVEMKD